MTEIGLSLFKDIPYIMAWFIGIVLSVKMLKTGGGRVEKLLLIGCCLMLAEIIIRPFIALGVEWFISGQNLSNTAGAQVMGLARFPTVLLNFTAFVCLVWAFWLKFRVKKQEVA